MEKLCIKCRSNNVIETTENNLIIFICQNCGHKSGQTILNDGRIVQMLTSDGRLKHASVAAIIERNGKYLLSKRRAFEFGYANISGHIEYGESPEEAIKREVFEETGMIVRDLKNVFNEEVDGDKCRAGADIHDYICYKVSTTGEPVKNNESLELGWFTSEEMSKLNLVFVTKLIYQRLGII